MDNYFTIGRVVNTQGLKGDIRVLPSTDDPDRFALLTEIDIFFGDECRQYMLSRAKRHKSFVLLKLDGVDDRTTAEGLVGGLIKIPPEKALPLAEDEYYERDLLDMTVVTETGEVLGVLRAILHTGANDVYVVRSDKEEILIPAIKQCVLKVAVAEKVMTVRLMEGLRP